MSSKIIPVVLSADDTYAPYLGVTVQSVAENAVPDNNYKIVILDGGISEWNKNRLLSLAKNNVEISFFDISDYLKNVDLSQFHISSHFALPTYFRFFIPEIFSQYEKVIYIDCDLVVLKDISPLLDIELKKCYFAAAKDFEGIRAYRKEKYFKDYCDNVLKLKNPENYIQAGVIVFNIKKCLKENLKERLLQKLAAIERPMYVDQDVLNAECEGAIDFLDMSWNYTWNVKTENLDDDLKSGYENARKNIKILHFAGNIKPWSFPERPLADFFWNYARRTPFYEEILQNKPQLRLIKAAFSYNREMRKYYFYKLISRLSVGKLHDKIKKKYKEIKKDLRKIRKFLKG